MKNIKILDFNKHVFMTLNNIIDDEYYMDLTTGAETYSVTLLGDTVIPIGYYIVFSYAGKLKMLEIKTITHQWNGTKLYAEWNGIRLSNSILRPFSKFSNPSDLLDTILYNTDFETGYLSPELEENLQSIEISENTSVYKVLQNMIDIYKLEIEFEVKQDEYGNYINYINLYTSGDRGKKTYKRFIDGESIEIDSIEEDGTDRISALVCSGKNGNTIIDLPYAGQGNMEHPINTDYIVDRQVQDEIGLIYGNYKSDNESSKVILEEGFAKLSELSKIKTTYNCKSVVIDESEEVGDRIYVISDRYANKIMESCRISTLRISFSNPSKNQATFQDWVAIKSKIRDGDSVIQDAINDIDQYEGRELTYADKIALKDYLTQLGVNESEIEALLKKLETEDDSDQEDYSNDPNYEPVYCTTTSGLYIGGNRVAKIKDCKGLIVDEDTTDETLTAYAKALRYYNELAYFGEKGDEYFLGCYSDAISDIIDENNNYKLNIIINNIAGKSKIGADPYIITALIKYVSDGEVDREVIWKDDPNQENERYGLMGIPKSMFGKNYHIKLGNGKNGSFIPSLDTLEATKGKVISVSSVENCYENVYNQIKLGTAMLIDYAKQLNYNILAGLIAYFEGVDYVIDMVGKAIGNTDKAAILQKLGECTASWCLEDRDKELLCRILSYYKIVKKQLPYVLMSNGKKAGLGCDIPNTNNYQDNAKEPSEEEPDDGEKPVIEEDPDNKKPSNNDDNKSSLSTQRKKIVEMANKVLKLGKDGKAWYSQCWSYRTTDWNHKKKILSANRDGALSRTSRNNLAKHIGCYGWDCSSLAETCYRYAGLVNSKFTGLNCSGHTIQDQARNIGCEAWTWYSDKNYKKAKPGDLVMFSHSNVTKMNKKGLLAVSTHHVAIYVGNGYLIHARDYNRGIRKTHENLGTGAFFIRINTLSKYDK